MSSSVLLPEMIFRAVFRIFLEWVTILMVRIILRSSARPSRLTALDVDKGRSSFTMVRLCRKF